MKEKFLVFFLVVAAVVITLGVTAHMRLSDARGEIAEITESIGTLGDRVRVEQKRITDSRRYIAVIAEANPELIFKIVDADIKMMSDGRADEILSGLVLGASSGDPRIPNVYVLFTAALKAGASKEEVGKRMDRLAYLALIGGMGERSGRGESNYFKYLKADLLRQAY